MSVERRHHRRYVIDVPVTIRIRENRHFSVKAQNICSDGMFVETRSLVLSRNALVRLEFMLAGKTWEIPAVVVYSGRRGIGTLFVEPHPELVVHTAREVGLWPRTPSARRKPTWPPLTEIPR